MKYTMTFFKNQYDTNTDTRVSFSSFEEMVECLKKLSEIPMIKDASTPRICPAVFKQGTTRANDNVEYWGGWAAIDIDCDLPEDYEKHIRTITAEHSFFCHSTGSSTREKPKMRLIVPLDECPEGDTIKHLWFALQRHFDELGDEQTKDFSRMYMPPANYKNSYVFSFEKLDGQPIDVSRMLAMYPYKENMTQGFAGKLPYKLQERFLNYKKNRLDNYDYSWSSWQDCPFFPHDLAKEYEEMDQGWYFQLYRIMVSIAAKATKCGYPITEQEIVQLTKDFDKMNGNWYEKRPLKIEARRAINFVLSTN